MFGDTYFSDGFVCLFVCLRVCFPLFGMGIREGLLNLTWVVRIGGVGERKIGLIPNTLLLLLTRLHWIEIGRTGGTYVDVKKAKTKQT